MEAPDKIFILYHKDYSDRRILNAFTEKDDETDIEYIRKDIADEMVKSAEDHAYFAGQEKLREKLLEWAKEMQAYYRKRSDDIEDDSNSEMVYFYGKESAFRELIGKIESL